MNKQSHILFLSHGGGPLPLLGDAGHREMVECLQSITSDIPKPSSILIVSAHWEEAFPTITSSPTPSLIYDYYGFPEASYHIEYPCPGNPDLAKKLYKTLEQHGFTPNLNEQRGIDHGVFVPLKIMYPDADIPCVQLSLLNSLDPKQHVQLGKAIQSLSQDNLLVIGSGFSFHNLKAFFSSESDEARKMNEAFENWLIDTCSSNVIDEIQREKQLVEWSKAPFARFCHPREEHLLPLHVCYGAAGKPCSDAFNVTVLGKQASMYLWK